jgi:hypothetical protein
MDEYLPTHDLIDDSVRLEMNFSVGAYTDMLKFRWDVASMRCFVQALAGLLEFSQQMVSPAAPIGSQDIFVDVEYILFGLRNH